MVTTNKMFDLDKEHQHEAPVGASFAPSGWYAPFKAAIVYSVLTTLDLEQMFTDFNADMTTALETVDEVAEQPFSESLADLVFGERMGESDWYKYYYATHDDALPMCRLVDQEAPGYSNSGNRITTRPRICWRIETPVADVVSLDDEQKEKFTSDVLSWEVELKAIQKNSPNWFNWHGLTLPAMVQAYADLNGWKTPGFDISELTKAEDEVIVTDKFQLDVIGNTDVGLENSKLFIRRKALWASLGESNAKVSNPDKTESGQLKEALTVAMSNWNSPVFARVLQVPSPKVDDVFTDRNGQRRRNRVTLVTEFYRSEKEAIAAYEVERASRSQSATEVVTSGNDGKEPTETEGTSPVPEAWAEIPDDWFKTVRELKEEIGKKPKPVLKKTLGDMSERLKTEYMVTPEDVLAAWDEV